MRVLRENTFFRNKNDDAHEHVERVLDIVSLFSIPITSHDAIMMRVFPITLIGSDKRWIDRIPLGTIYTWDILEKAFIQRYYPPSKTAKQLEKIHNFKQEGNETLYQAWERRKNSSSLDGIVAIRSKVASLGRHMNKLKENMHAIQVGYRLCRGTHLDKEFPLNKEEIEKENGGASGVLPCQLPPKELNPESFTLPCTIGNLNVYALADLGASINIMPYFMFKILKLTSLKETTMLDEMVDMSKKDPMGIVENVLVPITGRKGNTNMDEPGMFTQRLHSCKPIRVKNEDLRRFWPTCDPNLKDFNGRDSIYGNNENGFLKQWYCFHDNERKYIMLEDMEFCDYLKISTVPTWELRCEDKDHLDEVDLDFSLVEFL
ncbi:phospholipase-like protein [Tanacetum coccineum]